MISPRGGRDVYQGFLKQLRVLEVQANFTKADIAWLRSLALAFKARQDDPRQMIARLISDVTPKAINERLLS